ncbi:hypothetical protein LTS15_011265 [Exophiala xenobiotica]|nr:hypothetical protein LTS15_011265 [Exophiala xenobiotica]
MAFLNDSVEQSPPPTILPPTQAASNLEVDLSIRVQNTFDSVPTITPPQEKITPLQQAVVLDQADDARRYLQNRLTGQYLCFPERPREFILPMPSVYQLLEGPDFESARKQLGFKYSYNAHTSILSLFPMPGTRHARTIDWLSDVAKQKVDSLLRKRLVTMRSEDWDEFQGEWEESLMEPDLGISWREDDFGDELHTVVEGTSKVSRFVFVNIITDPEYRSPKELDIDELKIIHKADFQLDSDQGPLWYKGVQWVGKSTLFWEVWERSLDNGEPTQIFSATIDPNDSETQLPFFEIPTTIAPNAKAITVNSADIHELWNDRWKHAIIKEAVLRMRKYVRDVYRRRKYAADLAEQKDEAVKKRKRQEANEERTECWRRRSER